jgi:tetratricopeptide (TPR) repeat protein
VYLAEGRLDEASEALNRAATYSDPPAPPWTHAWLTGQVNQQQGKLNDAVLNFRKALDDRTPEMIRRGFDFSRDYEVRNQLGTVLFDQARQASRTATPGERERYLREAAAEFEKTLKIDSENIVAHYNLSQLYEQLGDSINAAEHRESHQRYKPDDNAADRAVRLAREKYPAANHAAEALVIYSLQRQDQPAAGGE